MVVKSGGVGRNKYIDLFRRQHQPGVATPSELPPVESVAGAASVGATSAAVGSLPEQRLALQQERQLAPRRRALIDSLFLVAVDLGTTGCQGGAQGQR